MKQYTPMKRALRWINRLLLTAAVIAALLWAIQAWLLPNYIASRLHEALPGAQFRLASVSPWRLELTDLALDSAPEIQIPSLVATYSPSGLIDHRIDSLLLTGAQIHATITAGHLQLKWPRLSSQNTGPAYSISRVDLRSSSAVIDLDSRPIFLPLEATLLPQSPSAYRITLATSLQSAPVTLTGTLDTTTLTTDLLLHSPRLDLASLATFAPPDLPLRMGGALALSIRYQKDQSQDRLSLSIQPTDAWIVASLGQHRLATSKLTGQIDSQLNLASSSARLQLHLDSGSLWFDGTTLRKLTADAALQLRPHPTGWIARLEPGSKLTLAPNDLTLAGTNLRALEGVFFIDGEFSPKTAMLSLSNQSWLTAHASPLADPARLLLDGSLQTDLSTGQGTATLNARSAKPLSLTANSSTLHVGQSDLSASLAWSSTAAPQLAASLHIDKTSLQSAVGLALSDIAAQIPLTFNHPPQPAGDFSVGAIAMNDKKLPPLKGSINFVDGQLQFAATWPILSQASLLTQGQLHMTSFGPAGQITASIPSFKLTDETALRQLIPLLNDATISGTFALDASVKIDGKRIEPRLTLTASDAQFASNHYEASASGIEGAVTLADLSPLSTPGNQRIRVKQASLGKLQISSGLLAFRLEDPASILVERIQFSWAGGRLYSYDFRVNPADPTVKMVVYGDNLNIKELLSILTNGKAAGEGSLYGRLPVEVRWPKLKFGRGFLYATPGTGFLQLGDSVGVVGSAVDQSMPGANSDPKLAAVKDRLMEALRDFEYDRLRVDFTPENDDLVAVVQAEGRGRQGARQAVVPTINFHGLNKTLQDALVQPK